MNSVVSNGSAIEPMTIQRMSSVDEDHASVVSVSNDEEESSRDRDDDQEDRVDPSEKQDEMVVAAVEVVVTSGNESSVQSPISGHVVVSPGLVVVNNNAPSEQVSATGVASPVMRLVEDGESVSSDNSLTSDDSTASATVQNSVIALTPATVYGRPNLEDAWRHASEDPQMRRNMLASYPVGPSRTTAAPRFGPYARPSQTSRTPPLSGSNNRPQPPSQTRRPSALNSSQQDVVHRRRTSAPQVPNTGRPVNVNTNGQGPPTQQQPPASAGAAASSQQVIRSAIVGNRTIITTKTPSKFPFSAELKQAGAAILGDRYVLLDLGDGTSLYKCIDVTTKEEFVCKIANNPCTSLLEAHFRLEGHPHINPFRQVIHGAQHTYLFFEPSQGDLHSYVRIRKRLREAEAKRLFRQMCETVKACHDQGIVLRDLKLRKFIFADEEKTQLRLESLEDAVVLEDPRDDLLQDKRGCPAYVSPEILKANTTYSGKAADMWSLGVILYTMLVGRYPFNDSEHASLFAKISRGQFHVPECLSSKARCVIRALLRRHPEERITSEDLLHHPWLTKENFRESVRSCSDQTVPMDVPKRQRASLAESEDEDEAEEHADDGEEVDEEEDEGAIRAQILQANMQVDSILAGNVPSAATAMVTPSLAPLMDWWRGGDGF